MNCRDIAELCPLYLSGELDPANALAFAEHLRECQACATELKRQTQLDALLRESILSDQIDTAALDHGVRARISSDSRVISWRARGLAMAAGVGVILLAAGLGYRMLFPEKPPRLFADAAQDHRNEVIRRQHRIWLSDPKAINDLAQRTGIAPSLVGRITPLGYSLVEAKLCRLDGRVFLHLVYAHDAGHFSVYLRALDGQPLPGAVRETDNGKPLHELASGHQHIASFQSGNLTAMFVTDQSDAAALSLARFAAQRL
jgi:anti-sigma factor RsiW